MYVLPPKRMENSFSTFHIAFSESEIVVAVYEALPHDYVKRRLTFDLSGVPKARPLEGRVSRLVICECILDRCARVSDSHVVTFDGEPTADRPYQRARQTTVRVA